MLKLVLQQSSYYLIPKKLLGHHGPQVGNFPSLAQCLCWSARNAVVVLTLQWLGKTLLWSTTWSQTPSDMPSSLPPTARLRDRRQSEMYYNVQRLKMSWEQVSKSKEHSRPSHNLLHWEKISFNDTMETFIQSFLCDLLHGGYTQYTAGHLFYFTVYQKWDQIKFFVKEKKVREGSQFSVNHTLKLQQKRNLQHIFHKWWCKGLY